jgi:hypothetical protein
MMLQPQHHEEVVKEKPIEYIKIGDIILITLSVKVFQTDIEAQEAQRQLDDGVPGKIELKEKKVQEDAGKM